MNENKAKKHKTYQLYLNAQLVATVAEKDLALYYLNIETPQGVIVLRIQHDPN